jgi:hypothetical protein
MIDHNFISIDLNLFVIYLPILSEIQNLEANDQQFVIT